MANRSKEAAARGAELEKAARICGRLGLRPVAWHDDEGTVVVEEVYRGPRMFEVRHLDGDDDDERTDAKGISGAVVRARVRAQKAVC
jgi:hypothetical protein